MDEASYDVEYNSKKGVLFGQLLHKICFFVEQITVDPRF